MASSDLFVSNTQKYTSTLPKTASRSDFEGPLSSKYVLIGGQDFVKLGYTANARPWLLAVSVIHPLVIIGCQEHLPRADKAIPVCSHWTIKSP